jgi:iron(III) transport system permease protein
MAGAIALVLLLIGWPLARLVGVLISDPGGVRAAVTGAGFGAAVVHSLETAAGTTVLAVPGGALLALLTARPSLPGRRTLQTALLLPLVVPAFVLGYSWTQAYGPAGFSDRWLGFTMPGLFGPIGIVVVGAVTAVPLSFLIVMTSLATRQEPDLERAARVFGADALTTLRTVTLPLLRAPLGAASALVFIAALEAFAIPAALGIPGGFETMTTRIYRDLALASDPASFTQAIALALGLVVLATCVVWPADRLFRPRRHPVRTTAAAAATQTRSSFADRLAAVVVWCYIALAVLVPLLTVLLAALTPAVGVSPTPSHWTLANFRQALAGPTLRALQHSAQLAAIAAVMLVLMGLLVTAVERRRHGSGLGVIVTLGYALPGSALAVGMVLAYGRYVGDTLVIILLAYLAKLWPLAHRPLAAVVDRLDPSHARAARISGAGPFVSWRTVILPRLSAALGGAALLVFVTVLHELTMSSLLYGPSSETLAVVVLNAQQLGDVGVTSALSVFMTGLLLVLAAPVLAWFSARRFATRRRSDERAPHHATPTTAFADVA